MNGFVSLEWQDDCNLGQLPRGVGLDSLISASAPNSETAAERIKAHAKVPVMSLSHPATAGPRDLADAENEGDEPETRGSKLAAYGVPDCCGHVTQHHYAASIRLQRKRRVRVFCRKP